jgi:hypothetical protein
MIDHDVELPDGRTVSVAEYGDASGRPVIHLHGASSCRFEAQPFDATRASAACASSPPTGRASDGRHGSPGAR